MVGITETVLRDGHQSLIATRMRTRHMLPAAERLDAIGYRSLEVWGGATFDVCLRFLHEDPWERLRQLKRAMPKTPLQMLLRGQNLVGYRHYADDVVRRFVAEAARQGIDIFRVFDALNDPRNMAVAIEAVKKAGARAQATICYTTSPVHTLPAFVDLGRRLAELGADELCVKDMGGFLAPTDGAVLVDALVRQVGLPVVVHTHSTSGMSTMTTLAVAEAGATAVDTAVSPFAGGASQPPTEAIVGALRGTALDPKLDLGALADLADYFRGVLDHYRPLLNLRSLQTDPGILTHQIPGGMLSNLLSQLQEQEALGRLTEVLSEVPRVRADLGYPPLVTPTSQIVGIQAVLNVLTGGRYRQITREVTDYVRGLYGTPPGPIDPDLLARVTKDAPGITVRPADLLAPELERTVAEVRAFVPSADTAEALSYAMFPLVFRSYRESIDRGMTADVLSTAAIGVVAALRASSHDRAPRPSPPAGAAESGGMSAWAHEGRVRLHSQRRWIDANHDRARR
ncbi:MAG TPA: pyruvate carboxylase subunit B [Thermoplasmata archaeon]|nr:pyruvate carboxylase subunit B [Thermoplasmata archaeon]